MMPAQNVYFFTKGLFQVPLIKTEGRCLQFTFFEMYLDDREKMQSIKLPNLIENMTNKKIRPVTSRCWQSKNLPKTIFLGNLHPSSFLNMKEHFQTHTFHHPTLSNLASKYSDPEYVLSRINDHPKEKHLMNLDSSQQNWQKFIE